MSVTLDSRGVFETSDGQSNLTVSGLTTTNATTMAVNALPGTGSFGAPSVAGFPGICAITAPGFYQVPVSGSVAPGNAGQGGFTGSLPLASAFPGGEILITDTVGRWAYLITGSIAVNVTGAGGTATLSSSLGTRLTVPPGGTVGFWSDSKGWLLCAVSGTVTLTP